MAHAESIGMLSHPDLERQLLRKSVGALEAARARCADCGRTPLEGETVHHYGHAVVCELCRPLRRQPAERHEVVHGCEHGHTVRVQVRAAA